MKITFLVDEDIVNYKKTSMFIGIPFCDGKCNREYGQIICQNNSLDEYIEVPCEKIVERYINNGLTEAIVIGGREPLYKSFEEVIEFIKTIRKQTNDDIIIYTGYNENEIENKLQILRQFKNIIIKFGRFVPGQTKYKDELLGVKIYKPQYSKKIS